MFSSGLRDGMCGCCRKTYRGTGRFPEKYEKAGDTGAAGKRPGRFFRFICRNGFYKVRPVDTTDRFKMTCFIFILIIRYNDVFFVMICLSMNNGFVSAWHAPCLSGMENRDPESYPAERSGFDAFAFLQNGCRNIPAGGRTLPPVGKITNKERNESIEIWRDLGRFR